jgi:hypothetical protein
MIPVPARAGIFFEAAGNQDTARIRSVLISLSVYASHSPPNWEAFMKWLIAGFASVALAVFCLSICTTEASASPMDGKGNCAGGACTGGGSVWNPSGGHKKPAKTTKMKK